MPERLKVTPFEAASVIVTLVFGTPSFFNEESSKKIHGEGTDFDPSAIDHWNTIFQDEYRSKALIASVTAVLDLAPSRTERGHRRVVRAGVNTLKLRSGLTDGLLRNLEETAQDAGTTRTSIKMQQDQALRVLRHPSLSIILHPFAPRIGN